MSYLAEHGFNHKSYRDKYEAEKQIRVYYIPAYDHKHQKPAYFYLVASALLHEKMMDAINSGVVPDFAVIAERGYGEPTEDVKARVKEYYGFDHDLVIGNPANGVPANATIN